MSLFHAVTLINHDFAEVLQFDNDHVVKQKVHQHHKFSRKHHSDVRTQHEFFGQVCDALKDIGEVLVVGGHTSLSDFKHYVEKHRAQTAPSIVGYEVVDHPTENQLVALARRYFAKYDQMAGTRPMA